MHGSRTLLAEASLSFIPPPSTAYTELTDLQPHTLNLGPKPETRLPLYSLVAIYKGTDCALIYSLNPERGTRLESS
eukprot:3941124-Rhodomonas_salina.1